MVTGPCFFDVGLFLTAPRTDSPCPLNRAGGIHGTPLNEKDTLGEGKRSEITTNKLC